MRQPPWGSTYFHGLWLHRTSKQIWAAHPAKVKLVSPFCSQYIAAQTQLSVKNSSTVTCHSMQVFGSSSLTLVLISSNFHMRNENAQCVNLSPRLFDHSVGSLTMCLRVEVQILSVLPPNEPCRMSEGPFGTLHKNKVGTASPHCVPCLIEQGRNHSLDISVSLTV